MWDKNGNMIPRDESELVTKLPINTYLRELYLELEDAHWNRDEAKADEYREKLAHCASAIERGETYWYLVHF